MVLFTSAQVDGVEVFDQGTERWLFVIVVVRAREEGKRKGRGQSSEDVTLLSGKSRLWLDWHPRSQVPACPMTTQKARQHTSVIYGVNTDALGRASQRGRSMEQ